MCRIEDKDYLFFNFRDLFYFALLLFLCCTIFIPRVLIGKVAVGLDDCFAAMILPFIMIYPFACSNSALIKGNRIIILFFWVMIILTGIIFGLFGSVMYLDKFKVPTETWQYVKRMVFFYTSLFIAYKGIISSKKLYLTLLLVVFGALLIGILQIIPSGLGEKLAEVYARSDRQLGGLIDNAFTSSRNYGVAGHSIAWGGFAMFSATLALAGLIPIKTSKTLLKWLLLFLAGFNVVFSGSRVAIVAFLIVYLCFVFIGLLVRKKKALFFLKYLLSLGVFILVGIHFFWDKFFLLFFRFDVLIEKVGGGRIDQVKSAMALLEGWYAYIFGVGNACQRAMAVSFGTEIEPVYLLVNYGILGVLLRYGLLVIIFVFAFRQISIASFEDRILSIAAVLAIIGYAVFSLGYFFYQELYVGVLPWILYGWIVGRYYRYCRIKEKKYLKFQDEEVSYA